MSSLPVNGAEMHYAKAGSGRALLLLHGQLCDHQFWTSQLATLSADYRVVAPSQRHYWPGACDEDSATFTTHKHALDLGAFIDALGIGPVHLLGHSRGGYLAFRVAQLFPQALRTLTLAEPSRPIDLSGDPASEAAGYAPTSVDAVMAEILRLVRSGDAEGGMERMTDTMDGTGAWAGASPRYRQMAVANATTMLAQAAFEPRRAPMTLAQIRGIGAPTLLIGGSRTPPPFPHTLSQLESALPDVRRIEIADAAHFMNVDQPYAFDAAVLGFLRDR